MDSCIVLYWLVPLLVLVCGTFVSFVVCVPVDNFAGIDFVGIFPDVFLCIPIFGWMTGCLVYACMCSTYMWCVSVASMCIFLSWVSVCEGLSVVCVFF